MSNASAGRPAKKRRRSANNPPHSSNLTRRYAASYFVAASALGLVYASIIESTLAVGIALGVLIVSTCLAR